MKTQLHIKTCPTCGSTDLRKVRKNWAGTALGRSYCVSALEFYECPGCGEKVYDPVAMRRIEANCPAFSIAGCKVRAIS